MDEPSLDKSLSENPSERRLDSWKEIALYLHRDVTTVQRWEKQEGMPVHRHLHHKRGSVYALSSELDGWRRKVANSVSTRTRNQPCKRRRPRMTGKRQFREDAAGLF